MRKFAAALTLPLILSTLWLPAMAAEDVAADTGAEPVTILYTNDVHTYID